MVVHQCKTLLFLQKQISFLNKLGVSEKDAFLDINFAPTDLSRNIAIVGFLHKRILGFCHRNFDRLLLWRPERFHTERGFGHSKQLCGHRLETKFQSALISRSIFALVDVYNDMSQICAGCSKLKVLQKTDD